VGSAAVKDSGWYVYRQV